MSNRVEAIGFESGIVKSWSGWDGDLESTCFYDPEFAIKIGSFEPNIVYENISIWFNLYIGTVTVYQGTEEKPCFEQPFKIILEETP